MGRYSLRLISCCSSSSVLRSFGSPKWRHGLALLAGQQARRLSCQCLPSPVSLLSQDCKSQRARALARAQYRSQTSVRREQERAWELPTNAHLVCAKWLRSSQRVCREQKVSCSLEPSSSCNAIRTWRECLIRKSSTIQAGPDLPISWGDRTKEGCDAKGAPQECGTIKLINTFMQAACE